VHTHTIPAFNTSLHHSSSDTFIHRGTRTRL